MRIPTCLRLVVLCVVLSSSSVARAQLQPDQIALIVNRNSPESAALADYYIKARNIPAERVLALDLPAGDEISFEQYEREVVPAVRKFLDDPKLDHKIACLVTFYGVPLKIDARKNSPHETRELTNLRAALIEVQQNLAGQASELERRAVQQDPRFQAVKGDTIEALTKRLDHATQTLGIAAQRSNDIEQRRAKTSELMAVVKKIREPVSTQRSDPPSTAPATNPTTAPLSDQHLAERRFDPDARRRVRELGAADGMLSFARVLAAHVDYLTPESSDAAFDNELALVMWPNYQRPQWMPNPLSYRYLESRMPPVMMVMRLDAPTPQKVRDIIATSIQIERSGLKGGALIDAGGAQKLDADHKNNGFWAFEGSFKRLALLLKRKTKVQTGYDEGPEVLPPHTAKGVALYTGWYSVSNYIPSADLVPGAVGYHVASYEMTSLHDVNNKGWCIGLLNDGAIATLGPVSEPFLHAFPLPEDFFPLLLTGQMTLAEVYWRTTPLTSWKICMVGDPLYTPYRKDPAIAVSDLPEQLQGLFEKRPAGR
ncbi:MAG: TIGR03790 family protein [Anaerolineae bacterium]|nr:TIGR03790 family protein [Phycisphaerae bacterium]